MLSIDQIKSLVRDVPDFPKAGIVFKDITPVLSNPLALKSLIHHLSERVPTDATHVVAVESRGFILGTGVAHLLGKGLVLVRKPGKLPYQTISESYALEYGTDRLEIHTDALGSKDKIVIIDDVLATGGTAAATVGLCQKLNAKVLKCIFMMELGFLNGRSKVSSECESLLSI